VFKGNLRAKDPAAAYAKMKAKLKVGCAGGGLGWAEFQAGWRPTQRTPAAAGPLPSALG
jgi:hypothetical protein